jgi:replication initiation and membrane attachment protein
LVMDMHWKEVVPADRYLVEADGLFNEGDAKVMALLYQPLIGPFSVSLYMTMKHQIADQKLHSEPCTHYFLMNVLDADLAEIYRARLKLEAIGLLETYVKETDGPRMFIYSLKPPLSPEQFFSDGVLNVYLYRKVGKEYFARLKSFFSDKALSKESFKNITKAFQEVFQSSFAHPPYPPKEEKGEKLFANPSGGPLRIRPEEFDYELLMEGLTNALIPADAFTEEVKEAILKLAFLYGVDPLEMKNLVLVALDEENRIDIEELRKQARDWYFLKYGGELPDLVERTQPAVWRSGIEEPKTQEERLIRYLETVSPRELLEDLTEGATVAEPDLKLIEDLMIRYKLPPGVVNVLIQFCLLKTDMKLSRTYVEKIAAHWSRKKIKTVREALDIAKKEHKQYLDWQQKKKTKNGEQWKPVRKEPLPEWFENWEILQDEKDTIANFEEEKRKLEEELRNL